VVESALPSKYHLHVTKWTQGPLPRNRESASACAVAGCSRAAPSHCAKCHNGICDIDLSIRETCGETFCPSCYQEHVSSLKSGSAYPCNIGVI
jgi:hypothetical protein